MKLVYINKKTNIYKYKDKKVLDLCINGSVEKYFNINKFEYFNFVEPIKSSDFKKSYLKKIDEIGFNLIKKSNNIKTTSIITSYRTLSKLSVSDNLVDKFWVLEQINHFKNEEVFIFIDDEIINKIFSKYFLNFKVSNLIPIKIFYYFFKILYQKSKTSTIKYKLSKDKKIKIFVGNIFECKRYKNNSYDEYFFSKYWNNEMNSFLFLNVGNWNSKKHLSNKILFKESFIKYSEIIKLLFISLKNFYFPIQIKQRTLEDILINSNLKIDAKTGIFIEAFKNYYIYNNLKFQINENKSTIIIPHEGRSYERIICSVFRNSNNKVIGYAHFPLSQRILNYNFGEFENYIYEKFSFYTLSKNNYEKFIKDYNWPSKKIKIGAHLKRKIFCKSHNTKKDFDILVLLGNELIQNIKILKFIELSNSDKMLKILVRLHPSARGIKTLTNMCSKMKFEIRKTNSFYEDVSISSIIAYGDTGASIDCLNYNIPLCYIIDDNCLLSDRIEELIKGHYRFFDPKSFRLKVDSLLKQTIEINFSSIINNYISPLDPKEFKFE